MKNEEELITLKTAKLLEGKGYTFLTEESFYEYLEDAVFDDPRKGEIVVLHKKGDIVSSRGCPSVKFKKWKRPSQSLLQKWLRVKHNIEIWSHPFILQISDDFISDETYSSFVYRNKKYNNDFVNFDSYEEALEKGLQEALKLI